MSRAAETAQNAVAARSVRRPRRGLRVPWWAAGLACYGAFAGYLYHRSLSRLNSSILGKQDGILFVWWLRWLPHALATGQSPFVTHAIGYPSGANEMWNTSVPLLGLLAAPITLTAGPVVAANLAFAAAPVVSGMAALWAIQRYVRRLLPALLGGAVYGFSPFIRTAAAGHLHLTWAFFPPLLFVLLDEILVRQRRSALGLGALLGLLCAAQLLVSPEVLALGALVALIGTAVLVLCYPGHVLPRVKCAVLSLGAAALVFLALGGYPLAVMLTGPQQVRGLIQPPGKYVADPVAFVVPVPQMLLTPPAARAISEHFDGGDLAEASTYLGIPMVLLILTLAVVWWRRPLVRVVTLTMALVAVLSLGPWLHLDNVAYSGLRLPWNLVQRVSLLRNAEPVRLSVYVVFLAALLLGLALDGMLAAADRASATPDAEPGHPARAVALRVAAAVVALGVVLPLVPTTTTPTRLPGTPAFFTSSATLPRIPVGAPVVVVPFPYPRRNVAMLWQARAGIRFSMPGGYQLVPARGGRATFQPAPGPLGRALIAIGKGHPVALTPALRALSLAWLRRIGPVAVVVAPMPHRDRAIGLLSALLGRPPADEAGVGVWWAPLGH